MQEKMEKDYSEPAYEYSNWTQWGYYVIGYADELRRQPTRLICQELYNVAKEEGASFAPAFTPWLCQLGYVPAIFVLGPDNKAALTRVFEWGESQDDDPSAREPLDKVKYAVGAPTIAQLRGKEGISEHKKIKKSLNNIFEACRQTFMRFDNFKNHWNYDYSYQENIRYLVTNIIAQTVFGIPEVDISHMKTLQDMSYALAHLRAPPLPSLFLSWPLAWFVSALIFNCKRTCSLYPVIQFTLFLNLKPILMAV